MKSIILKTIDETEQMKKMQNPLYSLDHDEILDCGSSNGCEEKGSDNEQLLPFWEMTDSQLEDFILKNDNDVLNLDNNACSQEPANGQYLNADCFLGQPTNISFDQQTNVATGCSNDVPVQLISCDAPVQLISYDAPVPGFCYDAPITGFSYEDPVSSYNAPGTSQHDESWILENLGNSFNENADLTDICERETQVADDENLNEEFDESSVDTESSTPKRKLDIDEEEEEYLPIAETKPKRRRSIQKKRNLDERTKQQNREAAIRYRQKKREESEHLDQALKYEEERNEKFKSEIEELQVQIKVLKEFLGIPVKD